MKHTTQITRFLLFVCLLLTGQMTAFGQNYQIMPGHNGRGVQRTMEYRGSIQQGFGHINGVQIQQSLRGQIVPNQSNQPQVIRQQPIYQAPVQNQTIVRDQFGRIINQVVPNQRPIVNQRITYPPVNGTPQAPRANPFRSQNNNSGQRTVTSSAPNAPIHDYRPDGYQKGVLKQGSKNHQGARYDSWAGAGLDGRTDSGVGAVYDSEGNKFLGAQGSVGGGLYGDAGVSQSGRIGKVGITNRAGVEGFLGTEADAKAGIGKNGAQIGAGAFSGGRVTGTVGTDVGPVGAGATAEGWAGAGLEAGAHAKFDDGKLRLGGELGAGLGVGGKIGVEATVDVGAIGDGVKQGGRWVGERGRDVGNFAKNAGQDVGNFAKTTGKNVGNFAKNTGRNVSQAGKKAGKKISNTGKKIGGGIKKGFGKVKKLFK